VGTTEIVALAIQHDLDVGALGHAVVGIGYAVDSAHGHVERGAGAIIVRPLREACAAAMRLSRDFTGFIAQPPVAIRSTAKVGRQVRREGALAASSAAPARCTKAHPRRGCIARPPGTANGLHRCSAFRAMAARQ
jgi:hypothetical protein